VDQAIYEPLELKKGVRRLHTGYDFPGPHQGNFCSNGVVTAERRQTAKLAEVKFAHQFIKFQYAEGTLTLRNAYDFRSLKGMKVEAKVMLDGKVKKTVTAMLGDVKPGETTTIAIPDAKYIKQATKKGQHAVLNVTVVDTEASLSTPAGHTVAHYGVDLVKGMYLPVMAKGEKSEHPKFAFQNHRWIENDRFGDTNSENKADCQITYNYLKDGSIDMIVKVTPKSNLRRVGVAAELDTAFCNVNYYGYGPYENYPDRMAGVLVGNYSGKALPFNADGTLPEGTLMEPYMKPQTTGDRLVYSATLTDAKGQGWKIECPDGIYFSANRYTDADLMNAQHTWDIKARPYIWLQLGMDIRGLGNASCGPGPMQKYVIDGKQTYEFRVRMKKI
jgi:beta-galactosidase